MNMRNNIRTQTFKKESFSNNCQPCGSKKQFFTEDTRCRRTFLISKNESVLTSEQQKLFKTKPQVEKQTVNNHKVILILKEIQYV